MLITLRHDKAKISEISLTIAWVTEYNTYLFIFLFIPVEQPDPQVHQNSQDQDEYLQKFPFSAKPILHSAVPKHGVGHADKAQEGPVPGGKDVMEPAGKEPEQEDQ
ncbi:MAG: hypothetical protein ABIA67_04730 [Candidatus Margulisiibacteriota bacterium]